MTGKALTASKSLIFLLLIIMLTACGDASSTPDLVAARPTATLPATTAPTATITPSVVPPATATPTLTPARAEISRPTATPASAAPWVQLPAALSQVETEIRAKTKDIQPVLLPSTASMLDDYAPKIVSLSSDSYTVEYTNAGAGKKVRIATVIPNPPPVGPQGVQRNMQYRGAQALYQAIDDTPGSLRMLMWDEPGKSRFPGRTDKVPYYLTSEGLTEDEFWQLANSLLPVSTVPGWSPGGKVGMEVAFQGLTGNPGRPDWPYLTVYSNGRLSLVKWSDKAKITLASGQTGTFAGLKKGMQVKIAGSYLEVDPAHPEQVMIDPAAVYVLTLPAGSGTAK